MTPLRIGRVRTTPMATATTCPGCQIAIDSLTGTADKCRPGEPTMCVYCYVYLTFTAAGGLRLLTNAEWLALPVDQREVLTDLRARTMQTTLGAKRMP